MRWSIHPGNVITVRAPPRRPLGKRLTRHVAPVLFIAPALIAIAVFRIWPILQAVRLSFTSWDGFSQPRNVGLANYRELWTDQHFHSALVNNLELLLIVPIFVFLPLAVAMILQTKIPGWRFFRSVFFFPTLISPVIMGVGFRLLLRQDGPFNSLLSNIGLGSFRHDWLVNETWARVWVVLVVAWAVFGAGTVIFMAGMGSVEKDITDSARVDGASWFRVNRDIVFWQLLPVIEMWTVFVVIATFAGLFPLILTLTNGGPGYATYTVDFYIYQQAFSAFRSGFASAVTVVVFALTLLVVSTTIGLLRRAR